jgi:hypothetical protein
LRRVPILFQDIPDLIATDAVSRGREGRILSIILALNVHISLLEELQPPFRIEIMNYV